MSSLTMGTGDEAAVVTELLDVVVHRYGTHRWFLSASAGNPWAPGWSSTWSASGQPFFTGRPSGFGRVAALGSVRDSCGLLGIQLAMQVTDSNLPRAAIKHARDGVAVIIVDGDALIPQEFDSALEIVVASNLLRFLLRCVPQTASLAVRDAPVHHKDTDTTVGSRKVVHSVEFRNCLQVLLIDGVPKLSNRSDWRGPGYRLVRGNPGCPPRVQLAFVLKGSTESALEVGRERGNTLPELAPVALADRVANPIRDLAIDLGADCDGVRDVPTDRVVGRLQL
mmetsp:Transcript_21700/g.56635  ORF Transcript_21700/g.56635 Transcript_21700/m.56635 type:complete len:281 (-) Transcript_21700:1855-2697(-)